MLWLIITCSFSSYSFHSGHSVRVHFNEAPGDLDGQTSTTELEEMLHDKRYLSKQGSGKSV